jgi:glycosyltransferase involved in cell wall biosynthesis
VQGLADEIVVLDSGSTDRTREICASYGARVIEHPFDGYIQQKNRATALCRYDHVLSLDADEVLTPELANAIRTVKADWRHDGYRLNRLTNYCGQWIRHGGWYPDWKLRLFDRRKGRWTGGLLHEELILTDGKAPAALPGHLEHYSYHTISDHVKRVDRYTDIGAAQVVASGKGFLTARMIASATSRFLRDYLLRAGFLDGVNGLIIASISAHAAFLKYAKARQPAQQRGRYDATAT